jgi:hypothetical protein
MLVLNVDTREGKDRVDKIGGKCTFTEHETLGVIQLTYCH